MTIFLVLIILFILLIFLSVIPAVKLFFYKLFESKQFKAIRFIVIFFGLIGVILGLIKWYNDSNPRILTEEVSFQLHLSKPARKKALADKSGEFYLKEGVARVLWNTSQTRFAKRWQPVVTEIDYAKNVLISSFDQDKGKLVSIADVKKALLPYKLAPTFHDFYIPPEATFNLAFKEIEKRKWCIIDIESGKFCLNLKVTGNAPHDVCYVKIKYKKKGLCNYFFADYVEYDKWLRLWIKSLKQIQENIKKVYGKQVR